MLVFFIHTFECISKLRAVQRRENYTDSTSQPTTWWITVALVVSIANQNQSSLLSYLLMQH